VGVGGGGWGRRGGEWLGADRRRLVIRQAVATACLLRAEFWTPQGLPLAPLLLLRPARPPSSTCKALARPPARARQLPAPRASAPCQPPLPRAPAPAPRRPTIIRKGSCLGAAVISMRMRHMEALMRSSPPRKLAAPSRAYSPTWVSATRPMRTCGTAPDGLGTALAVAGKAAAGMEGGGGLGFRRRRHPSGGAMLALPLPAAPASSTQQRLHPACLARQPPDPPAGQRRCGPGSPRR
jgi:hypothetical protein